MQGTLGTTVLNFGGRFKLARPQIMVDYFERYR